MLELPTPSAARDASTTQIFSDRLATADEDAKSFQRSLGPTDAQFNFLSKFISDLTTQLQHIGGSGGSGFSKGGSSNRGSTEVAMNGYKAFGGQSEMNTPQGMLRGQTQLVSESMVTSSQSPTPRQGNGPLTPNQLGPSIQHAMSLVSTDNLGDTSRFVVSALCKALCDAVEDVKASLEGRSKVSSLSVPSHGSMPSMMAISVNDSPLPLNGPLTVVIPVDDVDVTNSLSKTTHVDVFEQFFSASLPRVLLAARINSISGGLSPRLGSSAPAALLANPTLHAFQAFPSSAMMMKNEGTSGGAGGEDEEDEESVSAWLKETFSADGAQTKRLGHGKRETFVKRSVTRMSEVKRSDSKASNANITDVLSPPPATADESRTRSTSDATSQKGKGFSTPKDSDIKKRGGGVVGFKDGAPQQDTEKQHAAVDNLSSLSEHLHRDRDTSNGEVSSNSEISNAPHGEEDPFAAVKPLDTQTLQAGSPSLADQRTTSKRGSQYFRRQSAVLSPGAMSTANANAATGQTLHTTDVIQMRLAALKAPWLDVDSIDFDIFDAMAKIDSGEISLSSWSPSVSSSASSATPTPSNNSDNQLASMHADQKLSSRNIFAYVCMNVLLRYSFVDTLKVDLKKLFAFLKAVQETYMDNPYHNAIHAADVLQTSHIYLLTNDVYENFFDREILCLLLAALVHDVGHLGVNNQFLVKIHHPLAILYNGLSPLENMHSLIAFQLLERDDLNFLRDSDAWGDGDYQDLEAKVVEMVIATDMKFHGASLALAQDLLREGFAVEDADVDKLIKMIIHCADLSNPMKPRRVYQNWLERVVAEFFSQGAAEHSHGLPISPNFDRATSRIPEMQVGFINFVVKPYAYALSSILPPEWLQRLNDNLEYMQSLTGKAYERQARVLELCSHPWEDRWVQVMPFMKPREKDYCASSQVMEASTIIVGSADVVRQDTAVNTEDLRPASPPPPLTRMPSGVMQTPAAAMMSDVQTRFCLAAYEATHKAVRKLTDASADGSLRGKLTLSEHQRGFAVTLVRHLVKAFEALTSSKECLGGKPSIDRTMDAVRSQIRDVLTMPTFTDSPTSSVVLTDAQISKLPSDPLSCVQLLKTKWLELQQDRPFARYTPRGKEQNAYLETIRQCVQTFQTVVNGLSAATHREDDSYASDMAMNTLSSTTASLAFASVDPFHRGRGLYLSPLQQIIPSLKSGTKNSTFGSTHASSRASSSMRTSSPGQLDPIPINGRFSAPLSSTAVRGRDDDDDDAYVPQNRSHQLPPLGRASPPHKHIIDHQMLVSDAEPFNILVQPNTPHGNESAAPLPEPIDSSVVLRVPNAQTMSQDDEECEETPLSNGGFEELERQAQLHFQQSDDQWRNTVTVLDDSSPRSLGLASVGSFRGLRGRGSTSGSPSGSPPLARLVPSVREDGSTHPPIPRLPTGAALNHSLEERPLLMGLGEPPMDAFSSIAAAIPNAYFLSNSANGSPNYLSAPNRQWGVGSGIMNSSQSGMLGIDGLSFIPMVHSVNPSPRVRTGVPSPPPSTLEPLSVAMSSNSSGPALNDTEAHNQLQMELLGVSHPGYLYSFGMPQLSPGVSSRLISRSDTAPNSGSPTRQPSEVLNNAHWNRRSMSPENASKAVEDHDMDGSTTGLPQSASSQSLLDHMRSTSMNEHPSSPDRGGIGSPKRRSHRTQRVAIAAAEGSESPVNSPVYRQQLAEMMVNGIENHTFTSSQNGSPVPLGGSMASPVPHVTPAQQHEIDEGCAVPEVYRANSSRASSFRGISFRNNPATSQQQQR